MHDGVNFRRAMRGPHGRETVISHNVITSGLFPKHMGWSNEVFRDVDNVLGAGEGAYHVTSSLGCERFETLIDRAGYPKLDDYLGQGGTEVRRGRPEDDRGLPGGPCP